MFYVIDGKQKIRIGYDNVYSKCPGCGRYHKVDLQGIMQDIEDTDLTDTVVYCERCTRRRAKRHRGEPWAEMILAEEE